MAKVYRQIVHIDQGKCDGCGQCVSACAEGAIKIINGKAQLVSETYCDALGACLGECPRGAITIERREAQVFDEQAVHKHLSEMEAQASSPPAVPACPSIGLRVLQEQPPAAHRMGGSCPGSAMRFAQQGQNPPGAPPAKPGDAPAKSALSHWPVQLRLVPPTAPFLAGADILVCADCVPFAVPDFHERYLRGRAVLVGCPKLDDLETHRAKLVQILAVAKPRSVTVLRMEVPCCAGLANAVIEARDAAAPNLEIHVEIVPIGV